MGLINAIGLNGLRQVQFQNENTWLFYMMDKPNSVPLPTLGSDFIAQATTYLTTNLNSLSLAQLCQGVNLPFWKSRLEIHPSTNKKFQSDIEPLGDITLEYLETKQSFVSNHFTEWQDKVFDAETKLFKKGDHSRTAYLLVFGPNVLATVAGNALNSGVNLVGGNGLLSNFQAATGVVDSVLSLIPIAIYRFEGLQIQGMTEWAFRYDNGNARRVSVSLSVDRVLRADWSPNSSINFTTLGSAGAWSL